MHDRELLRDPSEPCSSRRSDRWRISAIGSIGAAILFLVTVTFLFTTPGVFQPDLGLPFLSPMPGQFLAKDIALFSISVWTAGETLRAARTRPGRMVAGRP